MRAGVGLVVSQGAALYATTAEDADQLSLVRVSVEGGEPKPVAGPFSSLDALTTDGTRVYWSNAGEVWSSTPGAKGAPAAKRL